MLMRSGIWTSFALCAAIAAGCGGGDTGTADTGASSTPTTTTAVPNPAEAEIRTVAIAYVHALAAKDFQAVCATRSIKDVKALEAQLGSCEAAYRTITAGKPVELYSDAKPGDVRIRGDVAGVDITAPRNAAANLKLAAVHENGRWLLRDLPDAQIP